VKPSADKQIPVWHQELEMALMALDDCPIECDGMSWATSHLLSEAGIPHSGFSTTDVAQRLRLHSSWGIPA